MYPHNINENKSLKKFQAKARQKNNQIFNSQDSRNDHEPIMDPSDMKEGLEENEAINNLEDELFSSNMDCFGINSKNISTKIGFKSKMEDSMNFKGKILNFSLKNQSWYEFSQNNSFSEKRSENRKSSGEKEILGKNNTISHNFNFNKTEENKNEKHMQNIYPSSEKVAHENNNKNSFKENYNELEENSMIEVELDEKEKAEKGNFYCNEDILVSQINEQKKSTQENTIFSEENLLMNSIRQDDNADDNEKLREEDCEIIDQICTDSKFNPSIPEEELRTLRVFNSINLGFRYTSTYYNSKYN